MQLNDCRCMIKCCVNGDTSFKDNNKHGGIVMCELFLKKEEKALNDKLNELQNRSKERLLSVESCAEHLTKVENCLGITRKAMTGTKVVVHASMEKLPHAYKYAANSTKAVFTFDGKHWRFLTAYRDRMVQRSNYFHSEIELSDSAKEGIISRYRMR
jgi:hypothetical protein